MKLIGIGGNLPSQFGSPEVGLPQALRLLETQGVRIKNCSPFYGAKAVPASDQPDFVNAVAIIETTLPPEALLSSLQSVELEFGRIRGAPNAARSLDLDLLAYDLVHTGNGLQIPHPRMHLRAFVLAPLCDIAPDWLHPVLNQTARALLAALPEPLGIWRLPGHSGRD